MSIFLLVQKFWEGLIPEEELPDFLICSCGSFWFLGYFM